jgi:hypothetical protein
MLPDATLTEGGQHLSPSQSNGYLTENFKKNEKPQTASKGKNI